MVQSSGWMKVSEQIEVSVFRCRRTEDGRQISEDQRQRLRRGEGEEKKLIADS
jgi:hypothetical protein